MSELIFMLHDFCERKDYIDEPHFLNMDTVNHKALRESF
jgi:hypothetical protein